MGTKLDKKKVLTPFHDYDISLKIKDFELINYTETIRIVTSIVTG